MSESCSTAVLFEAGDQLYGLDVSDIIEVIPAVHLRKIPSTPEHVAGIFCYRGMMVPVLDVTRMLARSAADARFSTRIVLVRYRLSGNGDNVLGLLVSGATRAVAERLHGFMPAGISTPDAPYLGKLVKQGDQTIQLLTVDQLVPDSLRQQLFAEN